MEKQTSDEYSSVLLAVYEERCRFNNLLMEPSILERELPNLDNETKVELYKYALDLSKEPRDVKDKLWVCIDILENDQIIQCYMDEMSKPKEDNLSRRDEDVINNILKNIEEKKKAKKGIRGLIKALRS